MGLGVAWILGGRLGEGPCSGNQGRRGARTTSFHAALPAGPYSSGLRPWDRVRSRPLGGHVELPRERPLAAHPIPVLVLLLRYGKSDYVLGRRAANVFAAYRGSTRSRRNGRSAAANGGHRAQSGRVTREDDGHRFGDSALGYSKPTAARRSCPAGRYARAAAAHSICPATAIRAPRCLHRNAAPREL